MGYYTTHELEIIRGDDYETEHKKEISALSGYNDCFSGEGIKWYDHEKHMRAYSKKHPETLFKLIGDGEENGDLWHEYYLNGQMQRCKAVLTFPSFDSRLLS